MRPEMSAQECADFSAHDRSLLNSYNIGSTVQPRQTTCRECLVQIINRNDEKTKKRKRKPGLENEVNILTQVDEVEGLVHRSVKFAGNNLKDASMDAASNSAVRCQNATTGRGVDEHQRKNEKENSNFRGIATLKPSKSCYTTISLLSSSVNDYL